MLVRHEALRLVEILVKDAECVEASRLGSRDDSGVGTRLTRAVTALLGEATFAADAVATLRQLLLRDGDVSATPPRPTPLWLAMRESERRHVVDALRRELTVVVSENIVDRDAESRLQMLLGALEKLARLAAAAGATTTR